MAEFASKGVAGSGLGLGIAGTALSVLNSSANGNGLLGGLFGNGNQNVVSALQAELKCCCEKQELREQIVLGKVNELALTTQAMFGCIDQTIAGMMGTIGKITDTIVPMSAICPTPMAKHKLLEAIEKRNKESYHTEGDIRAYKDALKALYYLISIEKSK